MESEEKETELVYVNARYYDPEIGRFISPDPLAALGQKLNRYTYSRNNPINYLDPTGLTDEGVWFFWNEDSGGSMWVNVSVTAEGPGPGLVPGVYVDPVAPDNGVGPLFPDPGGPGGGDPSGGPGEGGGDGTGGGSATGPASGENDNTNSSNNSNAPQKTRAALALMGAKQTVRETVAIMSPRNRCQRNSKTKSGI